MAKRGRTASVDKLLARLNELDKERVAVMAGIKAAVGHILGGETPAPRPAKSKSSQNTAVPPAAAPAPSKRAPMSAEARAKIAAAQRRRWAKQKTASQ